MNGQNPSDTLNLQVDQVPLLDFDGITQADFEQAFRTLLICTKPPLPNLSFPHSFVAPGGHYGNCWWQLDSSLALSGYKWYDLAFTKQALRNFIAAQQEDGRIPLYGFDKVQDYEPNSSLPKLFIVTYEVIMYSGDVGLAQELYPVLKRYLDWWFENRTHAATGLLSAVFEETFVPYLSHADEYLAVDTNIEVAVGCTVVSFLADLLGHDADSKHYTELGEGLQSAIRQYLWNESKGAYYPYLIKEQQHDAFLQSTTFQALRLRTAPQAHADKLLALLQTDDFNWNSYAVTTAARNDPQFVVTEGAYQFNASWSGNVWTLRNVDVILALNDYGCHDLAAELALKTVRIFNNNYWEFASANDGVGHGVEDYAWTASQYIQLIVEEIFGIHPDALNNTVTIAPNLAQELRGRKLSLSNVSLFDGSKLSVAIDGTREPKISWELSGPSTLHVIADASRV